MAAAELEAVEGEVKGVLYSLNETEIKQVVNHLHLTAGTEGKSKFWLIKHVHKYLDSDEVVKETGDGGLAVMKELQAKIETLKAKPDSTTMEILTTLAKKELKLQGQVGASGQPGKLSYLSVARQIEDAITRSYERHAIVNALTRAIVSGIPLRGYLESRPEITIPQLRRLLRSHYKEGDALDSYQLLSEASQGPKESAQDFVIRAMNLRQKVLFASQEDGAPLKYDAKLVQSTFIQTLKTGLTGRLRGEMREFLQAPISDEDLLENLARVENLEEKRTLKRGPKARVNAVTAEGSGNPQNSPQLSDEVRQLMERMKSLQANIAALQEEVRRPKSTNQNRKPGRPRGCKACQDNGTGDNCRHCFKCGGTNHYARGCTGGTERNRLLKIPTL